MRKILFSEKTGRINAERSVKYKRICLKITPDGDIRLTAPFFTGWGTMISFAESHSAWIEKAKARQRKRNEENRRLADGIVHEDHVSLRKRAEAYLPERLKAINAASINAKYNRITLKDNRSNWGSCSSRGNINLNIHLMQIPVHLSDYVIMHELCHLRYLNHGKEFHSLLDSLCGGKEKEYSSELKKYSFLLRFKD